jgi:hypothetical protein
MTIALLGWLLMSDPAGQESAPPALNPFGTRSQVRDDAVGGYVELSDGSTAAGQVYLTRDARLKIYDPELKRQREVPLSAVRRIECSLEKEWLEKEWRFKENANDEKVYTGRSYPVRQYVHTLTLADGRRITGPLAAIVYVQLPDESEPRRYILHQRDKGPLGSELKSLVYVRLIELGDKISERGVKQAKDKG